MNGTAADRVRTRLQEWVRKTGHGSKGLLAKAVAAKYGSKKSRSWVTGILKETPDGRQDIRLKDLDEVATCVGLSPGELVSEFDHVYRELTTTEAKLLDYYRSMPQTVRHGWMAFLDYVFHFQQAALTAEGREVERRTKQARKREADTARLKRRERGA